MAEKATTKTVYFLHLTSGRPTAGAVILARRIRETEPKAPIVLFGEPDHIARIQGEVGHNRYVLFDTFLHAENIEAAARIARERVKTVNVQILDPHALVAGAINRVLHRESKTGIDYRISMRTGSIGETSISEDTKLDVIFIRGGEARFHSASSAIGMAQTARRLYPRAGIILYGLDEFGMEIAHSRSVRSDGIYLWRLSEAPHELIKAMDEAQKLGRETAKMHR